MKKSNSALQKAVAKRQLNMEKILDEMGIHYATKGGHITAIDAKPFSYMSRQYSVAIDVRKVAVEYSVGIDEFFCENYPAPVEKIKEAFKNVGFDAESYAHMSMDDNRLKMTFESLSAKEVVDCIQCFVENIECWHEECVDRVMEANNIYGMNRLA